MVVSLEFDFIEDVCLNITLEVIDVCWSPDNLSVASCSLDNKIRVWKLTSKGIFNTRVPLK